MYVHMYIQNEKIKGNLLFVICHKFLLQNQRAIKKKKTKKRRFTMGMRFNGIKWKIAMIC